MENKKLTVSEALKEIRKENNRKTVDEICENLRKFHLKRCHGQ
jgi:hypothetical protein